MSIHTSDEPWCEEGARFQVEDLAEGVARIDVTFGFMETPDVPGVLRDVGVHGIHVDRRDLSFFVSRAHLVEGEAHGLWGLLRGLFVFLYRNQADPAEYYRIPPGRVIDLGAQIVL